MKRLILLAILLLVPSASAHASGSDSIALTTPGPYSYGQTVGFAWSTHYRNNDQTTTGNPFFNVQIEVDCYQGGALVWQAESGEYLLTAGSPTGGLVLGGSSGGGWSYSGSPSGPASCSAILFHYGQHANFVELAQVDFTVG